MFSIVIGLIPVLGFGMMGPMMQFIGGNAANKQMGLVLATLGISITVMIFRPMTWSSTLFVASAINGIAWAFAQILLIKSFEALGVTHAIPITTGLQLLGTSLVGVCILGEWQQERQVFIGCLAMALIVFGVILSSQKDRLPKDENSNSDAAAQAQTDKPTLSFSRGLVLVTLSSVLNVLYASTGNLFKVDGLDLLFPQALFMAAATILIGLPICKGKFVGSDEALFGRKSWQNIGAGIFFAVGNAAVLVSNQLNGLAVGWTLSQLSVIVSTIAGLVLLHEKRSKRGLVLLFAGMALVVAGGILIGFTKG